MADDQSPNSQMPSDEDIDGFLSEDPANPQMSLGAHQVVDAAKGVSQGIANNMQQDTAEYKAAQDAMKQGDMQPMQAWANKKAMNVAQGVMGDPVHPILSNDYSVVSVEGPAAKGYAKAKQLMSNLENNNIKYYKGQNSNDILIPHSEGVTPDSIEELAQPYGQISHKVGDGMSDSQGKTMQLGSQSVNFADGGEVPDGLNEFLGSQAAPMQNQADNIGDSQPSSSSDTPPGLDEFIAPEMKESKYGGAGQQAIAGLEGLARGVAGPLAPLAETKILGVNPEDIRGREEANPITHFGSEIAGLGGSAIAGTGLGGALGKVGELVGSGTEALGKIGSGIVRAAAENAAFQGGEELSKMILKDPDQSVDSAVADMGLAALVGGGFGAVSPLWKATMGVKTGSMLKGIANKLGGIEGVVPDAVEDKLAQSGLDVQPELRAGLSGDPKLQQMFKTLEQSDTTSSGREFQQTYNEFRKQAGDSLVDALGKSPDEVNGMGDLSKYEAGKEIGNTLAKEYDSQVSPISKNFDTLKEKFKNLELTPDTPTPAGPVEPGTTSKIIDKISQMAKEEGWTASPSSDIMREVNRVIKELPEQKTVKNLSDYISQLGNNTSKDPLNGPLRRAGAKMNSVLKDAESDTIASKLGQQEGPAAVDAFNQARAQYRVQSALKDSIDSRLHVGGSTSGYAKQLREMAQTDGETLLRRLSGSGDADLLNFVKENYPQTADLIKQYHVNNLLKAASDKAKPGMTVNSEALLKNLDKMSPELKSFITTPESLNKINAIGSVLDEFNKLPHNFSNTARVADKLLEHIPGTAVGLATVLGGHSPVTGLITGAMTKLIGKDIPDAVKLGMLKFLGSSQRVDSTAFKSMAEFINHAGNNERLMNRAAKNLFRAGTEVLPQTAIPNDADRKKLQKALDSVQKNPEKLMDVSGKLGHYMPDHAISMGRVAANAAQFINGMKPQDIQHSPLDTPIKPSEQQKQAYNNVLDIAQQPLIVLKKIQSGTLTPSDVAAAKALYPALYNRMASKITDQMMDAQSKGETIPYKTKMSMSLFLGQALDSTMMPGSIQAAQPKPPMAQPQTAIQPASNPKRSMNSLQKLPGNYQTPLQESEADKAKRHQ